MNERIEGLIKQIIDLPLTESMQVIDTATSAIEKMLDSQLQERNSMAKEALQRYEEFRAFINRNQPKATLEAKRAY